MGDLSNFLWNEAIMKIGELARAAGTQAETIRYYERQRLLPAPTRTSGNYRVYDATHIQRLAFIRHCRCLDMALDEIRALLQFKDDPTADCADVNSLLDAHIGHVVSRIRELKTLEKDLRSLRVQCVDRHSVSDCGIINGIEKAARQHDHAQKGHTHEPHVAGVHREVGTALQRKMSGSCKKMRA